VFGGEVGGLRTRLKCLAMAADNRPKRGGEGSPEVFRQGTTLAA